MHIREYPPLPLMRRPLTAQRRPKESKNAFQLGKLRGEVLATCGNP